MRNPARRPDHPSPARREPPAPKTPIADPPPDIPEPNGIGEPDEVDDIDDEDEDVDGGRLAHRTSADDALDRMRRNAADAEGEDRSFDEAILRRPR